MKTLRQIILTGAIMAACVIPGWAVDCDDDPINLMNSTSCPLCNCGFDANVLNWTIVLVGTSQQHNNGQGTPDLGSQQITSTANPNHAVQVRSSCFPVTALATYGFGASFRLTASLADVFCRGTLREFSDTNCSTFVDDTAIIGPPATTDLAWLTPTESATIGATIQSAEVLLFCGSPPGPEPSPVG